MQIVTSFSPNRIDRQQYCLATWQKYGVPIVAVQGRDELDRMSPHFSGVSWAVCDECPPKITTLAAQATDSPILLVNSDISIKNTRDDFFCDWSPQPDRILKVGIRHDRQANGHKKLNRYGIDAFLITPTMAKELPELGFRIGQPAWDYWFVFHFHAIGYAIATKKSHGLIHAVHDRNWSDENHAAGIEILSRHYGINKSGLTRTIQRITKRK